MHFEPVPADTKAMDYIGGGYGENNFKFWNICDGKDKQEPALPDEWKNVQYAVDETLPVAKINKDTATIKVKVLGYKPGMRLKFFVGGGFKPLGAAEYFYNAFPMSDDGTLTVRIPLWLTREVSVGFMEIATSNILIAPGQVTEILMKVTDDRKPFLAFKGYMARTNMDLVAIGQERYDPDTKIFHKVKDCTTKEERIQGLKDFFRQRVADIKVMDCTSAAKDLLCAEAEDAYAKWMTDFANIYSRFYIGEDGRLWSSSKNFKERYEKNKEMLVLTEDERVSFSWQYINEPWSPCSKVFWKATYLNLDKDSYMKNPFNYDLFRTVDYLAADENERKALPEPIDKSCKAVIREYDAVQKRSAEALTNQEHIFFKALDDVAPENILKTILDRYKGKAVLIDVWATWCGPCCAGHKAMAPMKEQMKGKDVRFVYITSPTSPLSKWQELIADIDGDHYYLTKEQYKYMLDKYESNMIPTYAIYDRNGKMTYKGIGFQNKEIIKAEIEKAMK